MSIAWLSKCWPLQTPSATCKAVLLVLADHADEDGYCWPKVSTICVRTQYADRAVRNAIQQLESEGFITVEEDFEIGGRQTSNVYRLRKNIKSPPVSGAPSPLHQMQAPPAPDAPPTRTVNRTVRKTRENVGSKSTRRVVRSDDETAPAEESPAPGATRRKTAEERREATRAAKKPSAMGFAIRLRDQLESAGYLQPVNETAVAKAIRSWDLDPDVIGKMIDLFGRNPKRYLLGDEVPWVGFLRQREALLADAKKSTPRRRGSDPYANERIV